MVSTLLIPLGLGSVIKVDKLPHFQSMDHEKVIKGIFVRCFPWEKNETRPKGNWSMFFSYLGTTLLWAFWGLTLSYCSKKKEMVLMKITVGLTYILLGLSRPVLINYVANPCIFLSITSIYIWFTVLLSLIKHISLL